MRTTSRNVSFVLLLATGVVLAGNEPEAGEAQARAEAEQARAEEAQGQTAGGQDGTEGAQGQAEEAQTRTDEEGKLMSVPGGTALGMSILGNQEAPTSLVIVPWKTSELGNSLGIEPMLDDSRHPVDKDVFMRALRYYEIRSETSQGPRP